MAKGGEIFVFDMGTPIKILDLAKRMIQLSGLNYPTDINIEITGLRLGEKIYEELLADGENTKPAHHEKIMIARVRENTIPEFDDFIISLINLTHSDQKMLNLKLVGMLKKLVPEYKSQNSIYESLDYPLNQNASQNTIENFRISGVSQSAMTPIPPTRYDSGRVEDMSIPIHESD